MIWILGVGGTIGAVLGAYGIVGLVRDPRRITPLVWAVLGCGTVLVCASGLLLLWGHPLLFAITAAAVVAAAALGGGIGYSALTVFLLWSGVTVLRRESRTLGNALALLAGCALLVVPWFLERLAPPAAMPTTAGAVIHQAVYWSAVLLVFYAAVAFAAFLVSALLYTRRRPPKTPEAIIVLGSGLIRGEVPPLLASRLDRGLDAYRACGESPLLITSGGKGPDEPRAEGEAMREYLLTAGVAPEQVRAETQSRSTAENLRFSRALLSSPQAQVLVVTSGYHVFRAAQLTRTLGLQAHVVGSKTAWYYRPSAMLREFAAVIRSNLTLNLVCAAALVCVAALAAAVVVPALPEA